MTKKKVVKSRIKPSARKKAAKPPRKKALMVSRTKKSVDRTGAAAPTGACRYADSFGGMQCESPVTEAYCSSKGGIFSAGDRC